MKLLFAVTFALLALSFLDLADSSAYDKIVTHSRIRAKKQGPNMCALQQVMGTKKKYFSTCRNWYKGSICGKKAVVLYECCPGYMELDGMRGCPAVGPIDNIYSTLGLLGAKTTQDYSDISKLREEIEGPGSFTMFAPSNDAWELLDATMRGALEQNVNVELFNALHYHMAMKRLLTKDLKNDMTVESMYNNLGLYINHYSNGVVTVNCARIIHANQVATNGVVHVIDRVISAVGNTIKEVLEVNDDLTSLSAAAVASGLMDKLGEPGHYTLFAPTNEAFEKLDREVLERLMSDKTVLQALLSFHLLNSVQCSEAIMAGSVYETLEGSNIEIGCDGESLTVNGIKMVLKKDIVTSNGVIHLIDQVLMPDSAKQVMELVGETQSTFGDMISELGLAAAMTPGTEYTLLAPVNGAFSQEVMSMDQRLLKVLLGNHILKVKVTLGELYNGQLLETLGGKFLRVFIYRTAVCIENACMVRGSKEGSNGALHLMRTLIKPAQTTMYEILVADGRFKTFLSLMGSAGLTDLLKQEEGSYTLFAPTDDAFEGLTEQDILLLTSDMNALRTILLYHLSNGVFINGGLELGVTNLLKTIQGNNLQVLSVNASTLVNSVNVPDGDLMASNGVVHVIKTLLYPGDLPVGRMDLLTLLKRLIKYIQLKFVSGYTYQEIPLTFIKRTVTTTTHVVETVPEITTVTRVIDTDPVITKVTRVTGSDPTRVVVGGQQSITKVTRVIEGDPSLRQVTRVIESDPSMTKMVVQGEPSLTTVTRVIEGDPSIRQVTRVIESEPQITHTVVEGEPSITTVTRVVEGEPSYSRVTQYVEGESSVHQIGGVVRTGPVLTRIVEGEPSITKVTRVVEGNPPITTVTRVIETHGTSSDGELDVDGELKKILEEGGTGYSVTKVVRPGPEIIEGPDFSKITSFQDNPMLIDAESERITKLIQEGGSVRRSHVRRAPAGKRRRTRLVRRHPRARVSPDGHQKVSGAL